MTKLFNFSPKEGISETKAMKLSMEFQEVFSYTIHLKNRDSITFYNIVNGLAA